MSNLYQKIEKLCKQKNINITTFCRESGVSRANITDLKMGRHKTLSAMSLSKVAAYFGVSVDYLMGYEQAPSILEYVADGNGLHAATQLLVRQREPQGTDKKTPASKSCGGFDDLEQIYAALTPSNQAKLLELARLFLAAQRGKGDK